MERIRNFLWMCSGADLATLKRAPTEANKFAGIGGTILFTAILAFLSSAYAIYTVFDSYFAAIGFGLVWGLMIFNLDRYIVSSMKNKDNFWSDFFVASPRVVIAILLAIVISKPLELKIFEKEINAELITMEQEVFKAQEDQLKARYVAEMNGHAEAIERLKSEIANQEVIKNDLMAEALKEADGTGGSGIRNMGPIYRAKKLEADKAEAAYMNVLNTNNGLINEHVAAYNELLARQQAEIESLPRGRYNGFAARIDALGRLTAKSQAIALANLFIILLFIAIETAPIMVKLISYRSPYDFKVDAHEYAFEMNHKERTAEQFESAKNKIKFHTETGAFRVRAEIEAEKALIEKSIKERLDKLNESDVNWRKARKGFLSS
jgi:hypothetical protein